MLLAAFVWACGAHRVAMVDEVECTLGSESVPPYDKFKPYHSDDPDSGLIPSLNVNGDVEYYEIEEHTHLLKTSEYSFRRVDENNNSALCGRFHTYPLGKSADLLVNKSGQSQRLVRVSSARHGNALENLPFQTYFIRDKKKKTYYTIVRKRVSQLGALGRWTGIDWRARGISPGKIATHAHRALNKGKVDLFKIYTGKCKYRLKRSMNLSHCGEQFMTGVGTFGEWGMNWYMGSVDNSTNPEDAVATLQFQDEKWGKATWHKKQIFKLAVKSGDVGVIVINAFIADVLRQMELLNMHEGHNMINMDMR